MAKKPEATAKAAAGAAADHLTFTFTLPNGPKSAVVIIVGGADADVDGKIETAEVAAFDSNANNTWSREQDVQGPTAGMLFGISFTVGSGVDWKLEITNQGGSLVFSDNGTTVFAHETLGGQLS